MHTWLATCTDNRYLSRQCVFVYAESDARRLLW